VILTDFIDTRNFKVWAILSILFFSSCSSLDIKQNKTDPLREHRETDSKPILQIDEEGYAGRSLKELILGESNTVVSMGDQITFQVALDKLDFIPKVSVDSSSGVIITDWYDINDVDRIKIEVRVIDDNLLDESVQVKLFKQNFNGSRWVDSDGDINQAEKIKNSILNDARTIRTTIDLS
tara:strand:- start:8116 stop:8655 length:540 start_codon:yes stop_codon:yes gene_type:complete